MRRSNDMIDKLILAARILAKGTLADAIAAASAFAACGLRA